MARNSQNDLWFEPLFSGPAGGNGQTYDPKTIITQLPTPPAWKLSGLVLWLDAAQLPSLTIDGAGIAYWGDQSDSHNNATQPLAARRPAVSTAIFSPRAVNLE